MTLLLLSLLAIFVYVALGRPLKRSSCLHQQRSKSFLRQAYRRSFWRRFSKAAVKCGKWRPLASPAQAAAPNPRSLCSNQEQNHRRGPWPMLVKTDSCRASVRGNNRANEQQTAHVDEPHHCAQRARARAHVYKRLIATGERRPHHGFYGLRRRGESARRSDRRRRVARHASSRRSRLYARNSGRAAPSA